MVISFEEKDRAAIEEAGRKLKESFAELKRKLMAAWSEAVEPLEELAEKIKKALEKSRGTQTPFTQTAKMVRQSQQSCYNCK